MPPRQPAPPAILTLLCGAAAAIGVWLTYAADQVARGLAGALLGVPFTGIEISSDRLFLPVAHQGSSAGLDAGSFAVMVLAGPVGAAALAFAVFALARGIHAAGWLRGLALGWLVVALLWLPAGLCSAILAGGGGPVHELYGRLGAPMAGRWAALALGLLVLLLAAQAISGAAVEVGRYWMRADSAEFRRRLVRTVAGWPAVVALGLIAFAVGWAPSAWSVPFLLAPLAMLQIQTR